MKKINIYQLFILLLLPLLGACSKDEIIFDSEMPGFETRAGYQLIEAIMPQETIDTDQIYIIGEFNGGMDAVGDPRWQLEQSAINSVKWGIYLNPETFVAGKTLADGYTFYNAQQGVERAIDDKEAIHHESPALGGRENILIYFWADYFNKPQAPDEIEHDGYAIYVVDNSGYDELALYAWGDAEIFGGWPGIQPMGSVEIDGVTYKYFDTGAANEGLNVNLIFNNNGNGSQLDDYNVTLDQDYYLELTPDGAVPFDPNSVVTHDGYTIYVYNNSGWDELYLYMWGTVNDLNGAWPGMAPTGKQTVNGVTYTYFDLGAANCDAGLEEHVILNNGYGKQIDDVVVFGLDRDVYVELSASGAKEIDPSNYTPPAPAAPEPEPEPEPEPDGPRYTLYVENNTGWDALYLYAYGDAGEMFGKWPGKAPDATTTVAGVQYELFYFYGDGESENLIFNNGNGIQLGDLNVTLDKDYTIVIDSQNAQLKNKKR